MAGGLRQGFLWKNAIYSGAGSDQLADQAGDKTQKNRGRQRNKPVAPEQAKAQVAGQFAKAELLQQRREPADEHQGKKDDDEPADHEAEFRARPESQNHD